MKQKSSKQRKEQKCGFGYAIFKEKDEEGIIITTNMAHKKFRQGEDFWKALKLPIAEQRMIRAASSSSGAYLIFSGLGVGVLSTQYEMWSSYRVYIHLHEDPLVLKRTLGRMKHTLPLWREVLSREIAEGQRIHTEEADFDADLALILVDIEKIMIDTYLPCEERAEKGIKDHEFIEMAGKLLDCKINVERGQCSQPFQGYHTFYPGLHRSLLLILLSLLRETFGTCPIELKIRNDQDEGYQMSMKMYAKLDDGMKKDDAVEKFHHLSGHILRRYSLFNARITYQTFEMTDYDAEKLMNEYKNPDQYCVFSLEAGLPVDPSATPPGIMKAPHSLIMDDEN